MTTLRSAPGTRSEGQTFLIGPHLYFRAAELADAATAPIWRDSPFPAPTEVVEEQLRERFDRGIYEEERQQLLIACRRDNDQPVGSVDMRMSGWRNTRFDFVVDPLASASRQDSLFAEMLEVLIPWTIGERHVMTIEFVTHAGQPRVEQSVTALSGRRSGRLRDFRLVDGQRRDEIWYQILNPVWIEILGRPPEPAEGPAERTVASPARQLMSQESACPGSAFVVGERVVLRTIKPDEESLVENWSLRETEIVFPEGRWVVNSRALRHSVINSAKPEMPRSLPFAIALRETDELIGAIGIQEIDWVNRTAETAMEIYRKDHRNSGLGTEAKHLLLAFAFDRLGMHAVYSYVSETNPRSAAAVRKQGYRDAGYVAWDAFAQGGLCGAWIFDLLADEWRAARDTRENA